jgi:hypothetical protein
MEELLRNIDEESPPSKRPRGPGYLWNESSRIEVTESTRNIQDLDVFKLFIGTDSAKGCQVTNFITPKESVWMEM